METQIKKSNLKLKKSHFTFAAQVFAICGALLLISSCASLREIASVYDASSSASSGASSGAASEAPSNGRAVAGVAAGATSPAIFTCFTQSTSGKIFKMTGDDRENTRHAVKNLCVQESGSNYCPYAGNCRFTSDETGPFKCTTSGTRTHSGQAAKLRDAIDTALADCLTQEKLGSFFSECILNMSCSTN
jgi:hypothetical protein